jgi:hypothetical protein
MIIWIHVYTRTELYGWGHKLVAEVCGIAEHIGVEIPPDGIFGKISLEPLGIQSVLTSQWDKSSMTLSWISLWSFKMFVYDLNKWYDTIRSMIIRYHNDLKQCLSYQCHGYHLRCYYGHIRSIYLAIIPLGHTHYTIGPLNNG